MFCVTNHTGESRRVGLSGKGQAQEYMLCNPIHVKFRHLSE